MAGIWVHAIGLWLVVVVGGWLVGWWLASKLVVGVVAVGWGWLVGW